MNVLRKHWVLSITSFLFLPIGLYAPRGLALLFVLTAILLIFQELIERRTLQFISWRFYIAAIAIPLYGAISSIWSITPAVSIKMSAIICGTIFVGMLLANNSVRKMVCSWRFNWIYLALCRKLNQCRIEPFRL